MSDVWDFVAYYGGIVFAFMLTFSVLLFLFAYGLYKVRVKEQQRERARRIEIERLEAQFNETE